MNENERSETKMNGNETKCNFQLMSKLAQIPLCAFWSRIFGEYLKIFEKTTIIINANTIIIILLQYHYYFYPLLFK